MYKIANQIIDAYDDIHWVHLEKVASKRPQTNLMMPEEHAKLHDEDFALSFITKEATKLNKFPINDYDNTWLSNEYFPLTCEKLDKTAAVIAATNINSACKHFGIEPSAVVSVLAMEKVASNVYVEQHGSKAERDFVANLYPGVDYYMEEKTASQREGLNCFADVERICDNYTHAQYVFSSPHHIKVGCAWFEEKHEKIPLEMRHKYATAVQLRAQEFGLPPCRGAIAKYASDAYSGQLEGHLASRRRLLEGSPYEGEFGKIAAQKEASPYQFAQLLHAFDKKAGLNRFYGSYLKDPYQATFASADPSYMWMSKKSSRILTANEIEAVVNNKQEKIAEYFGKGVAAQLRKDPVAIFESLPNDAKEIIGNIHDGAL